MKAHEYSITNEHDEQVALITWANLNLRTIPELADLFAIPNGGQRHPAIAAQLKAEGVKPGVSDLFLSYPSNGYHGLYIEMKRKVGSSTSLLQKEWIERQRRNGYAAYVCKGFEEAKTVIIHYLTKQPTESL
jgi:hypothetical protein